MLSMEQAPSSDSKRRWPSQEIPPPVTEFGRLFLCLYDTATNPHRDPNESTTRYHVLRLYVHLSFVKSGQTAAFPSV